GSTTNLPSRLRYPHLPSRATRASPFLNGPATSRPQIKRVAIAVEASVCMYPQKYQSNSILPLLLFHQLFGSNPRLTVTARSISRQSSDQSKIFEILSAFELDWHCCGKRTKCREKCGIMPL